MLALGRFSWHLAGLTRGGFGGWVGRNQAFNSGAGGRGALMGGRTHHQRWPACPDRTGHGLFLPLVPHCTGSGATKCGSRLRKLAYESPSDCPAQWWPPLTPGPSWKKAGPCREGLCAPLPRVLRGEGRETEAPRGKRSPQGWAGEGVQVRRHSTQPNLHLSGLCVAEVEAYLAQLLDV